MRTYEDLTAWADDEDRPEAFRCGGKTWTQTRVEGCGDRLGVIAGRGGLDFFWLDELQGDARLREAIQRTARARGAMAAHKAAQAR